MPSVEVDIARIADQISLINTELHMCPQDSDKYKYLLEQRQALHNKLAGLG